MQGEERRGPTVWSYWLAPQGNHDQKCDRGKTLLVTVFN